MSTTAQIQEIYVGLLGRAADAEGLAYWKAEIDGGVLTIEQLRANIVNEQPEWQSNLGTLSREDLVKALYDSMFNRAPEAAGLEYWTTGGGKDVNADQLVLALSNGASSTDRAALDNKTEAATFYTENVDTYVPSQAASAVANVDSSASSLISAKGAVAVLAGGKNETLTSATDTVVGTAKADFFNAPILAMNSGDSIDGGEGVDTLYATLNADLDNKVTLTSVDDVYFTGLGAITADAKNYTGISNIYTKDSTGKLTLSNMGDSNTALGFIGSNTNSIDATYATGTLSGANDTVSVVLENASAGVELVVSPGFESASISNAGTSQLKTLTTPGVETIVLTGSGTLKLEGDGAANPFSNVKTITASGFSGTLTGSTVTSGYSTQQITGDSEGTTMVLGSGSDNVHFASNAGASKSNTINLGAGDNVLDFVQLATNGNSYIFAGNGSDTVKVGAVAMRITDVISLGGGDDTVVLSGDLAHRLTLQGVENLTLDKTAIGANFIETADSPLNVVAQTGNVTAVNVQNLTAGSTVTVDNAKDETGGLGALTVGFKSTESAATIDINTKQNGVVTVNKVTNLTLDYAGAVASTDDDVIVADTTAITLNSAKALVTGIISDTITTNAAAGTKLVSTTVTGQDAVTVEATSSTVMTTVAMSAVKDLSAGVIGATSTKLTDVTLSSSTGAVTSGAIGKADNAGTLNVTLTAEKAIGSGNGSAILSAKLGDITATSATDNVILGVIGANATTIGDIVITAAKDVRIGDAGGAASIGHATPVTTSAGAVTLTSTGGEVELASEGIHVTDASGITVSLNAAKAIRGDASATDATLITNAAGDVNLNISGKTDGGAYVNATSGAGVVNLTASNTGGLTSTVTNAGTADAGDVSTINLGNAASTKTNTVTVGGIADTVNVTGGSGADSLAFSTANTFKGMTLNMGGGTDSVDFSNITHTNGTLETTDGVIVNLSGSTVTLGTGDNATSIGGFAFAEYNDGADKKIVTTVLNGTLTGVEEVTGTAEEDYFIANNTGNKITGGAKNDTIVLGAGNDTIVFAATRTLNGEDVIENFVFGDSGDTFDFSAHVTVTGYADASDTDAGVQALGKASAFAFTNGLVAMVDIGGTAVTDGDLAAALIGANKAIAADATNTDVADMAAIVKNGSADLRVVLLTDTAATAAEVVEIVGTLKDVSAFTGFTDHNIGV